MVRRIHHDYEVLLSSYTQTLTTEQETINIPSFSTAQVVGLTVAVTFILTMIVGLGSGMVLMYCFLSVKRTRKFTVSVDHPSTSAIQPTEQAVPVYEEVSPKEKIELKSNQAYGPVGQF